MKAYNVLIQSRRKEAMSHRKQHTSSESSVQVSELATADWQQLVQERLHSTLESQARALGAFVRVRRIQSASMLLRALLCYVLSLSSLKDLSMWSRLVGVTSGVISGQGWHKRLRQSVGWLLWLFGALLAAPPPSWSGPTSQRILLVDGTEGKCQGAKGALWRVPCGVNLPTPEKAEARQSKKEHEARAKGRKLSEQARFLAGFILLVTTLPLPQWPTSLVIELYACRWHLEVLFKRIKQLLDLHTLRCETPETAQAVIAARLFAWLLIEEDLEEIGRAHV